MTGRVILASLLFLCVPSFRIAKARDGETEVRDAPVDESLVEDGEIDVMDTIDLGDAASLEAEVIDMDEMSQARWRTLPRKWRDWTPSSYENAELTAETNRVRKAGITCKSGTSYKRYKTALIFDCNLFRMARNWSMYLDETPVQPAAHDHGGSTFKQRSNEAGMGAGAENLAPQGTHTAPKVVTRFLNSNGGHCENMARPKAKFIGVGYSGKNYKVTTLVIADSMPGGVDTSCYSR